MKVPVLAILAVIAITWAGYSILSNQLASVETKPAVAPPRTHFSRAVAAVGIVEPSSEVISVATPRAGIVAEVFVKTGDTVKKDQPLLKLRTDEVEAERAVNVASLTEAESKVVVAQSEVAVARAQVQVAESELAQSKRVLEFANGVSDSRVLSDEERSQRVTTVVTQEAKLASAKASLASAESNVAATKAGVIAAQAKIKVSEVDIDRSTIKAPLDGTMLQIKVHAGEFFAPSTGPAWITVGRMQPLHLRVDVDEHEAWRVKENARAEAQVRGNPQRKAKLTFVRFEPLVIPKKNLTGDAAERVDTRVLQVIYRIDEAVDLALFVGQQMDVFIEDSTSAVPGISKP